MLPGRDRFANLGEPEELAALFRGEAGLGEPLIGMVADLLQP